MIEAAGGIPWRRHNGVVEVAVVHRPKYHDWTFPKGKLDPGESHEDAAAREVLEETGFDVELGPAIGTTTYVSLKGPKTVRYWSMTVTGGRFAANDEVDDLRWLPPDEAAELLTYDRDRTLLRHFYGL